MARPPGVLAPSMTSLRVGVQLHPQATTVEALLDAAVAADQMGVDSLWVWDHFYPLYGDPDAAHFEAYTLLAAMAVRTSAAQLGAMVTCNSYRNPNLLADMARTIDHLAGGRFILGLGSGWFERDYTEYGYDFGTARSRLGDLERDLPIIRGRLDQLTPPPVGPLPLLIGGSGRKVTLRLVAEHANAWNSFGPPDHFAEVNAALDGWCDQIGRDRSAIERTVCINPGEVHLVEEYRQAGAEHLIVMLGAPYDLDAVATLVDATRS
jgi:probable F420-dependent oxidoreductase